MRRVGRPGYNVVVANQAGDGVGGIPAIAEVGDIVDPDVVARRVVVVDHRLVARPGVERRHDLATIAERANGGGRQGLDCRPRESADVKPADLRLPHDCDAIRTGVIFRTFVRHHPIGLRPPLHALRLFPVEIALTMSDASTVSPPAGG
jgi:hypothetical protein